MTTNSDRTYMAASINRGPYTKDQIVLGSISRPPIFGADQPRLLMEHVILSETVIRSGCGRGVTELGGSTMLT